MAQQIGAGRADELLQTATFVGASQAHQIGMVDAVVSADGLMAAAMKARSGSCDFCCDAKLACKQADSRFSLRR